MTTKVVLITGSGDYWGLRLAEQLAAEPDVSLIGLDTDAPDRVVEGLDFVRADVRDPALADFLLSEHVDIVCHLKFIERVKQNATVADVNVHGTRNVLDACARAGVRQVILRSSLAVYGAHPNNDAVLSVTHALRAGRRYGYTSHRLDIEAMGDGFRRQAEGMSVTNLRFAHIVGPTADTPMTRFLKLSPAPILLGFDPMQQIIHEDDVVGALAHAVLSENQGTYNIAANPPLPLSQMMALTRTVPVPILHRLVDGWSRLLEKSDAELGRYFPIEPAYLRYSVVGDVTRMSSDFGFTPTYTTKETLYEFGAQKRSGGSHTDPPPLRETDEKHLRLTIERRERSREQSAALAAKGEKNE